MDKKEKNRKLVCRICGQEVLKNPNKSGKPYAVRKSDPIICDICSHELADLDDENQEKLDARNYTRLLKKDLKVYGKDTKVETAKNEKEITLAEIISNVRSVIKGQDEQVKVISTAIFKNQRIDKVEIKSNIIILGDSGNGKTEIIKLLANEFKVPYVIEDATRYTEAGYHGASVDDMIVNLYKAAGDSITKAQKGILVIDEGDKKGSVGEIGRDVSGENVLFSLLKIVEGTKVPISDENGDTLGYMDTSRLTIVFIGAFPGLAKIRDKRLKRSGMLGFVADDGKKSYRNDEYIAQDFIEGGFPKEFVGRFDTIVELNKLTRENLIDIILNSKKSTFISYKQALESKGINLVYTDDVVDEIATEAEKLNTGARAIKKIVQEMFQNIMYQILSEDKQYTECIISKETVSDSSKYFLT